MSRLCKLRITSRLGWNLFSRLVASRAPFSSDSASANRPPAWYISPSRVWPAANSLYSLCPLGKSAGLYSTRAAFTHFSSALCSASDRPSWRAFSAAA